MFPELRLVFFDEADTRAAAMAYWRTTGASLPRGTAVRAAVDGGGASPRFVLTVRPDTGAEDVTVVLEHEHLLAALLRACRERRVPIPRNAAKRVVGSGTGLALMIALGTPPSGVWPMLGGK